MGIKANDLDNDLKNFKNEDQTIATVEAAELTNYLHISQDDALASGTTAERVKKFFDFIPLHVFLPWLRALTEMLNESTTNTGNLREDLSHLDSGFSTLKTNFENHLAEADQDLETINAALAEKANKSYVDEVLALKAGTEEVNTALAEKANKSYVDEALALKADTEEVNTALAEKANSSAVTKWQNQLVFTDAIDPIAVTTILRATGDDSNKKVFLLVKSTGLIYNVSAQEVSSSLGGLGTLTPVWGIPTDLFDPEGTVAVTGKAVAAAVAGKADTEDVNAALALKADKPETITDHIIDNDDHSQYVQSYTYTLRADNTKIRCVDPWGLFESLRVGGMTYVLDGTQWPAGDVILPDDVATVLRNNSTGNFDLMEKWKAGLLVEHSLNSDTFGTVYAVTKQTYATQAYVQALIGEIENGSY